MHGLARFCISLHIVTYKSEISGGLLRVSFESCSGHVRGCFESINDRFRILCAAVFKKWENTEVHTKQTAIKPLETLFFTIWRLGKGGVIKLDKLELKFQLSRKL
ncbi:hypothetical protein MED217_06926 [Leeuwenhoekiella blandensis MED217]|uniref:Uncharacterized protein n=1 Tax=Leeuwenhoekiella blandensis (strain CECT 7118 / CCUG 51940 / KCTC 22103 / MED217) TaxID=398720 RepID=A3XMW0_LEEBM|nr:hypothetical protein MED217_06926 [Leeuwenhoekiella blandensis MED217]HCW64947.1 hypothetical protein [Leeuwenhoekiella sp.]